MATALQKWHDLLESRDLEVLDSLLHDDVVMYSPVVHTPQRGKAIVSMYLTAADQVLNASGHFKYVRELVGERDAVLEFETEIDGRYVNGVDMLRWDDNQQLVDFKVMVRPLQAVNAIHAAMGALLEKYKAG